MPSTGDRTGESVSQSTSILLLGDGPVTARLRQRLARHFLAVECARTVEEAGELARRCRFHVLVLVDPSPPWQELQQALGSCEGLPARTVIIADESGAAMAVDALRCGAADVLLRPFATDDLVAAVNAVLGDAAPRSQSRAGAAGRSLVGETAPMQGIRTLVERIAPADVPVLIEGEAGTGRKHVARLLHERSDRRGPFITVDCAAAEADRLAGQVAQHTRDIAAHGTLCLHEIHALPMLLQAEMLRNMEHGIAGTNRIVATTRANLGELVARQRFREDLHHRLNAVRLALPPLCRRRSDIPLLVAHFVDRLSAAGGLSRVEFEPDEIEALVRYDWPGNVRELRDVVEQALLRGRLPADALTGKPEARAAAPDYPLDWTLEQVKRHHMACVLEACDGNKSAAARRLDISRKTLDRKLGPVGRE
jgi:DNA-binding NtrC family response regulator